MPLRGKFEKALKGRIGIAQGKALGKLNKI
jgi:hypothetical protein